MKIFAWSDGHGEFPHNWAEENHVDVVIIAGDIVPLHIQRNPESSLNWFESEFFDYVRAVKADKVILVAGNHDFMFEYFDKSFILSEIKMHSLDDKLIYLQDDMYEYGGEKFYGTPWIANLRNWAFYAEDLYKKFSHIQTDTTILITHMPPHVMSVGSTYPFDDFKGYPQERNYGSFALANRMTELPNLKLNFCGHVHTGTHGGVKHGNCTIYNVSIKNEDYDNVYNQTYVDTEELI